MDVFEKKSDTSDWLSAPEWPTEITDHLHEYRWIRPIIYIEVVLGIVAVSLDTVAPVMSNGGAATANLVAGLIGAYMIFIGFFGVIGILIWTGIRLLT